MIIIAIISVHTYSRMQKEKETLSYISEDLGINILSANIEHEDIQYGGILNILGDGHAFWILSLDNTTESIVNQIEKNIEWKALPFTDNLDKATYGRDYGTSYVESLVRDDYGEPLFPRTKNGYYFFRDFNNDEGQDTSDDSNLFNRHSYNFTVALFDADTNKIYYFMIDT